MINELRSALEEWMVRRFGTVAALGANGTGLLLAAGGAEARRIVMDLIPEPLRPQIWSMDRKTQGDEIRRLSAAQDRMLEDARAPR